MIRGCVLLVVAAAVLPGCGKTVQVVFVNYTDRQVPLDVQAPGEQHKSWGIVDPRGGAVPVTITVPKERLGQQVQWQAGARHSGSFPIAQETKKNLRIDLRPEGARGPYEWKGRIRREDDDD